MNTENNNEYLFNSKQDKQYEKIIQLLKEGGILDGRREQK